MYSPKANAFRPDGQNEQDKKYPANPVNPAEEIRAVGG
jgi:hypothetical protein